MSENLVDRLTSALRTMAQAYAPGDQVAPCAVIWPDPERLWESIMPQVQALVPELFALGDYDAAKRTGPSLWLRCIEARSVDGAPPAGTVPIFYLPGISRDKLRAAEDCPQELAALVELQYRGVMWLHVNGKEWTPNGFLVSKHGGLDLDQFFVEELEAGGQALGVLRFGVVEALEEVGVFLHLVHLRLQDVLDGLNPARRHRIRK